jgi:hypothetical protein
VSAQIQKVRKGIIESLDGFVGIIKRRRLLINEQKAFDALIVAGKEMGFVKDPSTGYWYLPEDYAEKAHVPRAMFTPQGMQGDPNQPRAIPPAKRTPPGAP